eukprot:s652_g4.t1
MWPSTTRQSSMCLLRGQQAPLRPGLSVDVPRCSLIRIMPRGIVCGWSDELQDRVMRPDRWNPDIEPPCPVTGLHYVFQGAEDQVVQELDEDKRSNMLLDNVGHGPLTPGLRALPSMAAVYGIKLPCLMVRTSTTRTVSVLVFLDLRPLAHFPQWLQLPDTVFDARAYFDGLQIEDADGHDDPPGNSGPDESGDSSSGTFDPLPDSSDFSESPPPPGGTAADVFLQELAGYLQPYRRSALILGGIDVNGRVPTECAGHTGDLTCGSPDRNGTLFLDVAKALGLWLPSTYSRLHSGSSTTFHHVQGSAHRIDYAVVGGAAHVLGAKSFVATSFDTLNHNEDHEPAVVAVSGTLSPGSSAEKLWRPRFNTEKMLTPGGKATIANALAAYVPPPWTCHPDQHCQSLQDFLMGVMRQHFSSDDAGPRASYINDAAYVHVVLCGTSSPA